MNLSNIILIGYFLSKLIGLTKNGKCREHLTTNMFDTVLL